MLKDGAAGGERDALPLPPAKLVRRVGWDLHSRNPVEVYEERGEMQWRLIKSLLPGDHLRAGTRVLDFGCGAGRIVRHALLEDRSLECWGCDIDSESVDWMQANICPPLRAVEVQERPPTPFEDSYFDLIYAFSVFTHLLDSWSAWLLELHRILSSSGVLVVTVFGPGARSHGDSPLSEDAYGMNVFHPGTNWDAGGPLIAHSEWWLHAHWGRAFEIMSLTPADPSGAPPLFGQGVVVMRKKPLSVTTEDLEMPEPGEPRELAAARENIRSLSGEIDAMRKEIEMYATSRSWRLTAPLRRLARALDPNS